MASYHSLEKDPESGMRDNIKQFNRIRMEWSWSYCWEGFNNTQTLYRLLKSLPKEYETFAGIQRSQKEIPTLTEVTENPPSEYSIGTDMLLFANRHNDRIILAYSAGAKRDRELRTRERSAQNPGDILLVYHKRATLK